MADEEVHMLDVVPEVLPDFPLRGTLLVDEIVTDLDLGTVGNGQVWAGHLDQMDQPDIWGSPRMILRWIHTHTPK